MRSEFFFLKIMFVIVAKKWGENIMLTLVCFVEEKRFLNSRFFFNFFAAETLDLTWLHFYLPDFSGLLCLKIGQKLNVC